MPLNFDPDVCLSCDSYACLAKCQYIDLDPNEIKEEKMKLVRGEYSRVLKECATCYACEEYCPYENHPFYQIVELQEKYNVNVAPENIVRELLERYEARGEFVPKKVGKKVVHICLFPEFKDAIKGKLFEGLDVIRGRHLFCNLVYLHFGKISVILERANKVIENMKKLNFDEVILFHDECYGFYNSFAKAYGLQVPFKTYHLFEYLYTRLKELEVKPLGIRVAYQRPCSNRLSPETDKILDKIFDLIGVERADRKYDRENALCCGAAFRLQGKDDLADEIQKKNVDDMVESGATHVVFNCPMCYLTLSKVVQKRGLTPIMISELCKMAIGEEPLMSK